MRVNVAVINVTKLSAK